MRRLTGKTVTCLPRLCAAGIRYPAGLYVLRCGSARAKVALLPTD